MTTSSSATVGVVETLPVPAHVEATYVPVRERRRSPAARQLRRAFDALLDAGALLLAVWLIPFVILAISAPIVLTLWAVLALIHRL